MTMMICLTLFFSLIITAKCATPYFWHITDLHYDPEYAGNFAINSCNEVINNPGKYGDFECDSPYELIRSSVKAMVDLGREAEFILYTGDTPAHMKNFTAAGWSTDVIISFLQNATDLLKQFFPDTPVVMALGNNDYFPKNQLPGVNNPVYEAAADMSTQWLDPEAVSTFKKGAYYTQLMNPAKKLRVVVTNSHMYAENNQATAGEDDPGDQYIWLQTVLTAARTSNERVHLVAHTPTGVMPVSGVPRWLRDADNTRFSDIIVEFSDVIMGVYACHEHVDTFRLFYKEGKAVVPMFVAPSVTPWRARITDGVRSMARNPGIRKVLFDELDGHLVDIEQYYLNLTGANVKGQAQWLRLYTFRAQYVGVTNVTAVSLHQLVENFKVYANNDFHHYYDHFTVNARHTSNLPCDCLCKYIHTCAMQCMKYADFNNCYENQVCSASSIVASFSLLLCILMIGKFCI